MINTRIGGDRPLKEELDDFKADIYDRMGVLNNIYFYIEPGKSVYIEESGSFSQMLCMRGHLGTAYYAGILTGYGVSDIRCKVLSIMTSEMESAFMTNHCKMQVPADDSAYKLTNVSTTNLNCSLTCLLGNTPNIIYL